MSSLCGPGDLGSALRSTATISAVSSTESVVWVTKASRLASRGSKALRVGRRLDQRHRASGQLAHGADHLRVAGVADQHDLEAAS